MPGLLAKPISPRLRDALAKRAPQAVPTKGAGMRVRAAADETVELLIYGDIGARWWDDESITARSVIETLRDAKASTIEVRINSNGGSVSDGIAIYNELRRQVAAGVTVNCTVDGVACSIASLIAAACDHVRMPANTLQMLHAPWGSLYVDGNAKEIREVAAEFASLLEVYGKAMSESYARKAGKPAADFDALWETGKDTWYTAAEALAAGLADEVIDGAVEDDDQDGAEASAALVERLSADLPQLASSIRAAIRPPQQAPRAPRTPSPALAGASSAIPAATTTGVTSMPNATTTAPAAAQAEQQDAINAAVAGQIKALQSRNNDIVAFSKPHMVNATVREYVDGVIAAADPTVTADAVGRHILSLLANGAQPLNGGGHVVAGADASDKRRTAMANALETRAGMAKPDPANPFRGQSMTEIARACVVAAGVNVAGLDKREIVGLAFTHSSSL